MEVVIKKLDHFGRGITYINDKICFVDFALPDEIVDIEITKEKKKYLEGKIIKFIKTSDKRVESKCPYFKECGGCDLRHLIKEEQDIFKTEKVKEILFKFANIPNDKVKNIVSINKDNYRNKVVFHVKNKKLGFYKRKSHDLIEIDYCLNLDDRINKLIPDLKKKVKKENPKSIMVRVSNNNDDDEVIIESDDKEIISNIKDKKYLITKDDFFQINKFLTEYLYDEVVKNIKKLNSKKVLDLYCGTGTIGIYVSDYVESVVGVEKVSSSIKSANKNKKLNKIDNIKFIEGTSEEVYPKLKEKFDTVICDPPRSGLEKRVIDTLKEMKPKNIIYISCDPVTLARDLKVLKEIYNIEEITPFDMFENTYHVECVCILKIK